MSKLHKLYPTIVLTVILSLPLLAFATSHTSSSYIDTTLTRIRATATFIISLLFVIATLVFLWGVVKFIASAGDEAERKKARGLMTWGIIGLAVMAAAWGITQILIEYFQVPTTGPTPVPIPRPT